MATLVSELIVSLIDRATAPARAVAASVGRLRDAVAENNRRMDEMRGRMVDATAAGIALAVALSRPIKSAMALEESLEDVNKIAGFSAAGLGQFKGQILDLTKTMPMTATELLAIAEGAASAGTAAADLVPTTELIAKAALAWGMSAEDAGENIAKIRTGLGLTIPEVGALADVMNYLADNTAASAPDLTAFVRRVGVLGKMAGLNAKQVAAFGSAIVSSGAAPDVAATGFQAMVRALTKGTAATKGQREAFADLGLNASKVSKGMQTDAQKTILDVLGRLKGLSADKRLSVANQLFGDEGRPVLALIDDLEGLRKTLEDSANASKTAGSVQAEFDARTSTTANRAKLFGNAMNRLSVAIGDAFLAVRATIDVLIPYIDQITALATAHPEAVRAIVGTVAALAGLRIATTAARWGFLFLKGGMLQTALSAASTASAVGRLGGFLFLSRSAVRKAAVETAALAAAQVRGTQRAYAMARAAYDLARNGGLAGVSVKQAARSMAEAGAAASAAQQRLAAANGALASTGRIAQLVARGGAIGGIASMLSGLGSVIAGVVTAIVGGLAAISAPVWVAIAAVAALGLAIYRYWEPISNFVMGFSEGIAGALGPMVDMLMSGLGRLAAAAGEWATRKLIDFGAWLGFDEAAVNDVIAKVINKIVGLSSSVVQIVKAVPGQVMGWIGDIFSMKDYSAEAEASFREAGQNAGMALANAIKDAVNGLVAWFADLPGRIKAAIGSINISSLITWPTMPSWLGGGGRPPEHPAPPSAPPGAVAATNGARAANDNAASAANAAAPAIAGARAAGGPVVGGRTYLVGETGRELFTPAEDGYVHDAYSTRQMAGAGAGVPASQPSQPSGGLNINLDLGGVTICNEADIDRVIEAVDRKLRDAFDGLQTDQGWSVA